MKRTTTLLLIGFFWMIGSAKAQVTDFFILSDSVSSCQNTLDIQVMIGSNPETNAVISVNWGDGSSSTYNYTSNGQVNTADWIFLTHGYSVPGNYFTTIDVFSDVSGLNLPQQSVIMSGITIANCGHLYIYTTQTNPITNYVDATYDFTDVNGITTTISSANTFEFYSGLNIANAPYTVSINDTWLSNNGLTQITPDMTINSFDANGLADLSGIDYQVICSTPSSDPDVAITWGWNTNVAPFEDATLKLSFCNFGCQNTTNATVSIALPNNFVLNTLNLTNISVNGNILTFDLNGLSGCTLLTLPFTFPGSTPLGTVICWPVTISAANDTDLSNNTDTICGVVVNSYDPNDKQVDLPINIQDAEQETLTYMIRFQNDGNYDAVNVVITDTLDTDLDISTFEVLQSKHPVATTINPTTRAVTFSFANINLGQSSQDLPGSQGFVSYRIREAANLPLGTVIENTAAIYFDFNMPIITNTTYNINSTLSTIENNITSIELYPNPAKDIVSISGGAYNTVKVLNMNGQLVLELTDGKTSFSTAHFANGIYQVLIETTSTIETSKLIIQH
jgi:hypothetical protein